jgi:hypothetical protein
MKKIAFILFSLLNLVVANASGQALNSVVRINDYVKHIDSLKEIYDSLKNTLTDSAYAAYKKLSVEESISEGEYLDFVNDSSKIVGGAGTYIFRQYTTNTIFRIYFEGGKHDTYIEETYYYNADSLVYAKMAVSRSGDQIAKPFMLEEYFINGTIIKSTEENNMPFAIDKTLIPKSLYEEGIYFLNKSLHED